MNINNKGVFLAFLTALISGFAVFFNKFAIGFWQNSSVFTTAKNLVAALFLTSCILLFKNRRELKTLSKKQWLNLILIGFIGGSVPFLLFFKGLIMSSAINAAFIHKTLFVWVALLAIPYLKEKITALQWVAMIALFVGVYFFSSPADFKIGWGEFMVFLATLMWAIENIIAKKALKNISSLTVGWGRMFFGSVFLLMFILATGNIGGLFVYDASAFGWLFFSGAVLFGYVVTWYAALKRAPATVVSSVLVLAAPITAFLNSVFVSHQFKTDLLLPIALIVVASLFVSGIFKNLKILGIFKNLKLKIGN